MEGESEERAAEPLAQFGPGSGLAPAQTEVQFAFVAVGKIHAFFLPADMSRMEGKSFAGEGTNIKDDAAGIPDFRPGPRDGDYSSTNLPPWISFSWSARRESYLRRTSIDWKQRPPPCRTLRQE